MAKRTPKAAGPSKTTGSHKLSSKEFWAILRANGGIFGRTAKAIREKYEISFTRQAVRSRAEKFPDKLSDIREETIDIAEGVLHELMDGDDARVKADVAKFYLKTIGKNRGYVEREEHDVKLNVNELSDEELEILAARNS